MSQVPTAAAWVRFLRNYGPIPTNDNMYDETIQRALNRHKIRPITLVAPLADRLVANFSSDAPVSHIITGTAGDGKTYHCRAIWSALGGDPSEWSRGKKIQTLPIGDRQLVIVKDLSELREEESEALILEFANNIADPAATTFYLFAANHGQLLEKLKSVGYSAELARVSKVVEDLLVSRATQDVGIRLNLSDLSRSPAAEMAMDIIREITTHEGWGDCDTCPHSTGDAICPIYENRRRLRGEGPDDPFKQRLTALIELSERNGNHFPVRQLLALVANSLLGHPKARDGLMTCADIPEIQAAGTIDQASVYRNIFGQNLSTSRAEKTELFRKMNAFGIGTETSNRVDNLLVYGADDPAFAADYAQLVLADPVYGATPAYVGAQRSYLEGADSSDRTAFLSALRSQRQRLFFTMPTEKVADYDLWDLTAFRFAGMYLDVAAKIESDRSAPRTALTMVVRGLNRIFTGMLVQNQEPVR